MEVTIRILASLRVASQIIVSKVAQVFCLDKINFSSLLSLFGKKEVTEGLFFFFNTNNNLSFHDKEHGQT